MMAIRKRAFVIVGCVIIMLAIVACVGVVLWKDHVDSQEEEKDKGDDTKIKLGNDIQLDTTDDSKIQLQFWRGQEDHTVILEGDIGLGRSRKDAKECTVLSKAQDQEVCFQWNDGSRVEIISKKIDIVMDKSNLQCFTVKWDVKKLGARELMETPEDCYNMSRDIWYGGFEEAHQFWPMNQLSMKSDFYITGDAYKSFEYGNVIEGLFLSSSGVGIYVDETTPLYLSINKDSSQRLCFKGKIGLDTPFFSIHEPHLTYDVCKSSDIASTWRAMSQMYLPKPKRYPALDVLRYPIWCTWATFKGHINQTTVMQFARDILRNNFSISQLEIDDGWTPNYGDLSFDTGKFPDPVSMIGNLSALGLPVTVWQHPFFNNDSKAFSELQHKDFLLKEYDPDETHLVSWWRGKSAGVLDVTNPEAVDWYLKKLDYLKNEMNVTSFKFDSGEVTFLDGPYKLKQSLETPNYFTKKYVELAYRADTRQRRQEVRVGFRSQESSLMVRMLDRDSNWSHNKGIKTLIPCALTFGISGYPYVLPDLIGGNAYNPSDIDETVLPEPELFVRWLQATVFMPILQFSVVPWIYNDTIVKISKKFVQLHELYADKIIELAKHAQKTGEPIIRPFWWIDPLDKNCLKIDSQFLLGSDVLVAPVLEKGSRSRDIYLPKGQRRDELKGGNHYGGKWLKNYQVGLDELAYFTKWVL